LNQIAAVKRGQLPDFLRDEEIEVLPGSRDDQKVAMNLEDYRKMSFGRMQPWLIDSRKDEEIELQKRDDGQNLWF
jgi:hypothetical protein